MTRSSRNFKAACVFGAIIFLGSGVQIMHAQGTTESIVFSRTLTVGSVGEDVRELQKILNRDEKTRIQATGPGSPGQETTYFGEKTAAAVAKFQEIHAGDVLLPVGLANGTGFVGSYTLAKLNKLAMAPAGITKHASSTPYVVPLPDTSLAYGVISQKNAFLPFSPDDLLIFGTSHYKIKPGDPLHITGFGFDPDTVVHIGSEVSLNAAATSSGDIYITMPESKPGMHDLWVTNSRGSTRTKTPVSLTVSDISDSRPTLRSVFPRKAGLGDVVVVTADKFGSTDNVIYSNLGMIPSIPSKDGKTISFKVNQLPNAYKILAGRMVNSFDVSFGIGTPDGLSLNYGYFTITK